MRALVVAALILASAGASAARTEASAWLRERIDVEWVVGAGGWRNAVGVESRAPGFDVLMGGGELVLGADVGLGLAVVGVGRVLAGRLSGSGTYLEGLGGLALQVRLARVRLRAGPAAGRAFVAGDSATLIGGFVGGSIDVFSLGAGRLSSTITVRLDIDGDLGAKVRLPDASVALAVGLGVRY